MTDLDEDDVVDFANLTENEADDDDDDHDRMPGGFIEHEAVEVTRSDPDYDGSDGSGESDYDADDDSAGSSSEEDMDNDDLVN